MRKQVKYLLLFLLQAFVVNSCVYDGDDSNDSQESQRLLAEAKAWYERTNDPVVVLKSSADDESDFAVMPDWGHYFTRKNEQYEVAEMELLTKHRFSVVDKVVGEKYQSTKNVHYRNSSVRLIYRKDKETGEEFGFYMNIVPEAGYLESTNFQYAKKTNYLDRDKTFSGRVLYYDMQGQFISGWRYVDGEVTAKMQHVSKDMVESLKSEPRTKAGGDENLDCYLFEYWEIKDVCYSWTQNNDYQYEYCYNESITYDYWYECYYIGKEEPPQPPNPNNPNGGSQARSIFKNNSLNTAAKQELDRALEDKLQECGYSAMYGYLTGNNFQINDVRINSALQSPGAYYAQSNILEFKSVESIYTAFPEEFMHFFQNKYYQGGISQYDNTGRSNIEFEAKLMQDLLCNIKSGICGWYGAGLKSGNQYSIWINKITDYGSKTPNYSDLLKRDPEWNNLNYWDFMEDFCSGHPDYDYPIDRNLRPQALEYIKSNCN